jgi:hypothetical protein
VNITIANNNTNTNQQQAGLSLQAPQQYMQPPPHYMQPPPTQHQYAPQPQPQYLPQPAPVYAPAPVPVAHAQVPAPAYAQPPNVPLTDDPSVVGPVSPPATTTGAAKAVLDELTPAAFRLLRKKGAITGDGVFIQCVAITEQEEDMVGSMGTVKKLIAAGIVRTG